MESFVRSSIRFPWPTFRFGLIVVTIAYVFTQWAEPVGGVRPPNMVVVNKCCRIGEQLDSNKHCLVGGTEMWWPMIYLLVKEKFYVPRGEAPRFFKVREQYVPVCENIELVTSKVVVFSNGTLLLSERNKLIDPENYCVDQDATMVCLPRPHGADTLLAPASFTKVNKCCPGHNFAYDINRMDCVQLPVADAAFTKNIVSNTTAIDWVFRFPNCGSMLTKEVTIAGKFNEDSLEVSTGSVTLDSGRQFQANEYCLEHTISKTDSTNVNVFTCAEHFTNTKATSNEDIRFVLYSIGLLISVIFLIATLSTGFLLPSNYHVLHWRCQTYYVACLLVGDLLLAITQIFSNKITGNPCIIIAVCMHFFFLAAFFWLNTMCFNIWWTFRDFRPTSLEKGQELVRLRIYKAYSWGVPLIITTIAAVLDQVPIGVNDKILRPGFGKVKCWFAGEDEILAYFFGPIGILLGINLLLFASTARQLTCGLWKRDDVKSTTERAALGRVCLKLVVVMGITWAADVISWAVGGPNYLWYVTDIINTLQGVFIFIVVGCQPQVSTAIKRLWSTKAGRCTTNTTHGPHSSSSQGLPSIGESFTNNTFTNTTTSSKVPMETIC